MDFSGINFPAVIVAALTTFVIRPLWYSSLLFGKVWMREAGITDEKLKQMNMPWTYALTFLLAFVIALTFARLTPGHADWLFGLTYGALAATGWVTAALGITHLYEQRSSKLFLINAGFHIVLFALIGTIVGAWR
jgi:hypothetical protein